MKKTVLAALLLLVTLTGCISTAAIQPDPTNPPPATVSQTPVTAAPQQITREAEEEIALAHAGVAAQDAQYLRSELDYDDGIPEYDIDFHANGWEYDYEVHAETGAILRSKAEPDPTAPPAAETLPAPTAPAAAESFASQLSREEAIAIALKDAGLEESQVSRLKAEFDVDDGVPHYDVEFKHDGWEYEYEIHAESGKILKWDKDMDD